MRTYLLNDIPKLQCLRESIGMMESVMQASNLLMIRKVWVHAWNPLILYLLLQQNIETWLNQYMQAWKAWIETSTAVSWNPLILYLLLQQKIETWLNQYMQASKAWIESLRQEAYCQPREDQRKWGFVAWKMRTFLLNDIPGVQTETLPHQRCCILFLSLIALV